MKEPSAEYLVHSFFEWLALRGEIKGDAARLLVQRILEAVAAYNKAMRIQRVCIGQQAAREGGKRWGGSQKGRHTLVTGEQIQKMLDMLGAGENISFIAKEVGVSRPTIYEILKSPEGESVREKRREAKQAMSVVREVAQQKKRKDDFDKLVTRIQRELDNEHGDSSS
jgi:DNA invertase Pin-like site-specific DNA recombinase